MSIQSPSASPPHLVSMFVLYICVSFCFGNKIIYVIFLDSTYMQ